MNIVLRIFVYLSMAVLGYAGVFGILVLRLMLTDTLPDDAHLDSFRTVYLGYGLMACIIGTGLGIISFFMHGRTRTVFLLLPALLPIAYSTAVMLYYSL